jgi:ribosome-binding protein aMBF1 (putative translation factor)
MTGFDRFFNDQMKSASFRSGYIKARAEIDAVDSLIRALDEARVDLGVSKAELARRISAKPEVIQKLFAAEAPNPTLATVVKLAEVLGYRLELVPVSLTRRSGSDSTGDAAGATG